MDKLGRTQQQADAVTHQMRQNVQLLIERGDKLDDIDAKAVEMERQAGNFKQGAQKLKCQYIRENAKKAAILTIIAAVLIILLIWVSGGFKQ